MSNITNSGLRLGFHTAIAGRVEADTDIVKINMLPKHKSKDFILNFGLQKMGMIANLNELHACIRLIDQYMFTVGSSEVTFMGDLHASFRLIAARQGVLSIYNFGVCLKGLKNDTANMSSDPIPHKVASQAWILFRRSFPHNLELRNAIGHVGEVFSNKEKWEDKVLRSDFKNETTFRAKGAYDPGSLACYKYSQGWNGNQYEMQIDTAAFAVLKRILLIIDPSLEALISFGF